MSAGSTSAASVLQLRAALRARFPTTQPLHTPREGLSTGVDALDAVLPHGGLPCGRLSEWVVTRGGGGATLLRALVRRTARAGRAAAVVDAGRTLAARDWVALAQQPLVTFVRPTDPADGPFCAELLLRTGTFALVVLDGVGVGAQMGARLAHRAEETGCALLILRPEDSPWIGTGQSGAVLRLRLAPRARPRPETHSAAATPSAATPFAASRPGASAAPHLPGRGAPGRAITAALVKGGPYTEVTLTCARSETNRLCTHPRVPDRRGAARRGRTW